MRLPLLAAAGVIACAHVVAAQETGARADDSRSPWRASTHALGRGRMRPEQVALAAGGARLGLLAGSCDGAELRSTEPVSFGIHTIRMRTPRAPGSLSAFFLYGNTAADNDEIDIELFGDGSRRAILTTWIGGRESRSATVVLPFDPADGVHGYTIRWSPFELQLRADDITLVRWTDGYPRRPMHLMASVWWPTWLECAPPDGPRTLVIERLPVVSKARSP